MQISQDVSNTCLFAPAPYYKQNKGFFLCFLFKPLSGLHPPHGLNKKASEKYPLFITNCHLLQIVLFCIPAVRTVLEKMGKTLFFRSGKDPLILSEDQREERKQGK